MEVKGFREVPQGESPMQRIALVRLIPSERIYRFDSTGLELREGDRVMVDWRTGLRLGVVVREPNKNPPLSCIQPLGKVIRLATSQDVEQQERIRQREREVTRSCLEKIKEFHLEMELVDVEFIQDGNKFVLYFTADGRIDFRALVKNLASEFHCRIEMRQIGARNRAKMRGGVGHCGRELCCCSVLSEFEPVTVKMAKDQGMSLDPSKISGVCGRLMCCLAYEHEAYCELKKGLPRCGKKVRTGYGVGKVKKQNILHKTLLVELEDGREIEVRADEISAP
jgi:cell fate regulator YaaT (PSP1 superfamily)